MPDSNRQMEKKKILARLSIALYQMTNEQLISLTQWFTDLEFQNTEKPLDMAAIDAFGIADAKERQLLIARIFLLINQLSETDLLKFMNRYEHQRSAVLREYSRVPCHINLVLAAGGRAFNCFAVDISAKGMFVETCEAFSLGQAVSICFSMDDYDLVLKFKGRVVRLEDDGVGVQYESLTGYQRQIMTDLIKRLQRQTAASEVGV